MAVQRHWSQEARFSRCEGEPASVVFISLRIYGVEYGSRAESEEMEASNDGGRGCVRYVFYGVDVLMASNCGGQRVAFRKPLVPMIIVTATQGLLTSNMNSTFRRDVFAGAMIWALAPRFQKFKTSDIILRSEASNPRWRFRTTTFGLQGIEDCNLP